MKSTSSKYAILVCSFILCISYSTNPPNGKTGAPGESVCAECHNPGSQSIDGTLEIMGIPEIINPSATYTLTVRSTLTAGGGVRAGFQMVALKSDNSNAGTMDNPSASSTVAGENGRIYHEHSPALSFGTEDYVEWSIDWTAPDAPLGDSISFYASSIIANGSGTTGDKLLLINNKALLDLESNTDFLEMTDQDISLFPNPADSYSQIQLPSNFNVDQLAIYNQSGSLVKQLNPNSNDVRFSTLDLDNGIYFLNIYVGQQNYSKKLFVQR